VSKVVGKKRPKIKEAEILPKEPYVEPKEPCIRALKKRKDHIF